MKFAELKDEDFLRDVGGADDGEDHFQLWWLGQSGFLIKWQDQFVLLDPYLSDSLTRKYAATDKPHVRITEQVIDPRRLDCIQIITSSHNHTDHLDAETLNGLAEANPNATLLLPAANVDFARERLGDNCSLQLIGLEEDQPTTAGSFEFTAIAAAHNEVERNDLGQPHFIGLVVKFGMWTVYHSGDTLWHDELVSSLHGRDVDVALVPINGNRPERGVAGNLNPEEAADLAHKIGASIAIPHHFDMFEFNTADPTEFSAACQRTGQRHTVLGNGGRWSSADLTPGR